MADMNALISAIPLAVDGQPITSNYHNTLRAAIEVIAQNLGVTGPPQTTLTLAAPFQPNGTAQGWVLDNSGTASKATGLDRAEGWFSVQLPNGGFIQSITFFGRKVNLSPAGGTASWIGQLFRQPVVTGAGGSVGVALFSADLDAATVDPNNNFREQSVPLNASRVVDNDNFKYIVTSRLLSANPAAEARITAVQIVVARSTTVTPPSPQTNLLFPFITNFTNL